MTETPFESPVEDAAEQRTEIVPDDDSDRLGNPTPPAAEPVGWDVDPAEAIERDVEVPLDEDEWR